MASLQARELSAAAFFDSLFAGCWENGSANELAVSEALAFDRLTNFTTFYLRCRGHGFALPNGNDPVGAVEF